MKLISLLMLVSISAPKAKEKPTKDLFNKCFRIVYSLCIDDRKQVLASSNNDCANVAKMFCSKYYIGNSMKITKATFLKNVPIEEYLAADRISRGLLFDFSNAPSSAHVMLKEKSGDHYSMGRAIHTAVLEPHLFELLFVRGPVDRRGNKWKDAKIALGKIQELLTSGDYDKALEISDSIRKNNKEAAEIIAHSEKEITCFAEDDKGRLHKARSDILGCSFIYDLKSTTSVDPDFFSKEILKHGYHVQAAYYSDLFNHPLNNIEEFGFIAVEKEPPYISNVFTLDKAAIGLGRHVYERGLEKYDEYIRSGKISWPTPQTIDVPPWAYTKEL